MASRFPIRISSVTSCDGSDSRYDDDCDKHLRLFLTGQPVTLDPKPLNGRFSKLWSLVLCVLYNVAAEKQCAKKGDGPTQLGCFRVQVSGSSFRG